jgi:hypothetical protein
MNLIIKNCYPALVVIVLYSLASPAKAIEQSEATGHWDFDVYLNDKKVGTHKFNVSDSDGVRQVISEASFHYKFLFISACRYEHSAEERWANDCLVEVDASTNANGKRTQVYGEQSSGGFIVDKDDKLTELPDCIMTFAYWNPEFLEQPRLLNPQTGDYVTVRVDKIGEEILEVRGKAVTATRFKLSADEIDLTLWYSLDKECLGLESIAKGGHIIRYELS